MFNKKFSEHLNLISDTSNNPLLASLVLLVKISIFTVIFSISNRFVGPLRVRDRESSLYCREVSPTCFWRASQLFANENNLIKL